MPSSPKNVSDALQAASAEGVLESTASFTLDPAEALRKSGTYQLPHPELWLVKIVQAAVSAGAESIDVKLERACVKVSVKGGQFPSATVVARQVSFESGESTQGHLLTGLRVLAVEARTAFVLQTASPSPEKVVVNERALPEGYQDEALSEGVTLALKVYRKGSVAVNPKAFVSEIPLKNLIRTRAAEYLALVRRCWVSTVPITIDGRPLKTRYYCATEGLEESKLTANFPCSMACGPTPVFEGRPKLRMRRPEKLGEEELPGLYIAKRVYRDTHFLVRDPEREAGAFLDIQMGTKDLVVLFVCDGALVASHRVKLKVPSFRRLPSFTGLRIYLQVERHELDLSEFQVRDAEVLAARFFQASLPTTLELWQDLVEYRGRIAIRRPGRESKQRGMERGLGFLGGASGLAIGCLVGSVPLAIGGGAFYAAGGAWYADLVQVMYGNFYGRAIFRGQLRPVLQESLLQWDSLLQQSGAVAWRQAKKVPTFGQLTTMGLCDFPKRASGRGCWAVKLVQAAVSSLATRVDFQFGAEVLEVKFFGVQTLSEKGRAHLVESLLGLAREDLSAIVLTSQDGQTNWTKDAAFHEAEASDEWRLRLVLPKSRGSLVQRVRRRLRGGCRITVVASKYLTELAWVSPVEIRMDQRVLETRYPHKRHGLTEVYLDHLQRGLPLGLVRVVLPPREEGLKLPLPARHVVKSSGTMKEERLKLMTSKLELPDTFAFWDAKKEGQCGGIVTVTGDIRGNSAVEFVLDGVIVDVQALYDSEGFVPQEKILKGFRLVKRLAVPRVGIRCTIPVCIDDLVDGRVKEPLKRARNFLAVAAPLLKELVSELIAHLPQLRYSVPLIEIASSVQSIHPVDRSGAQGDATREQKFKRPFHAKDLKKGLENFGSYLDGLLQENPS